MISVSGKIRHHTREHTLQNEHLIYDPETIPWQDTATVLGLIRNLFLESFPAEKLSFVDTQFSLIQSMFNGPYPGYRPMDTHYHDFEHTLQATLCLIRLLTNCHQSGERSDLNMEAFRSAYLAILLHDVGYLKEAGDVDGTGAKYTSIHESRSCEHAERLLRQEGATAAHIHTVCNLIRCTGPQSRLDRIPFQSDLERFLGFCVCSADFVGQMSDPGYITKLPALYREFEESWNFQKIPAKDRPYRSYEDMLEQTPAFWTDFVLPRLERECDNVWRFLQDPLTGNHPYRDAIELNIERVRMLTS